MNILNINDFSFNTKKQNTLLFAILLLGIGIRFFHFFDNRSLWMDEVYLSTSIVKLNLHDLITQPLYYQQKAPIGFLILVKLCTSLFGNNEMALRTIPLLSGLLSLLFFIPVSKFYLNNRASLLALAILSLSPALIYHSVEIKQYSTELLGTVLCLWLMIKFRERTQKKSIFLWGLYGACIIWFSYSSIFILAGIGIGLSIKYLLQKNWNLFLLNLIPSFIWILSFGLNYLLFTHKHAESEWIAYWFRAYDNFMPFPPNSISDLKWFLMNFYRMIDYPLGLLWNFNSLSKHQIVNVILKMPFLPIAFLILGFFVFFKKNKYDIIILSIAILLMFLASGLELYPLTERFWVFISPLFIIILAKGFEAFTNRYQAKTLITALFCLILVGPVSQSFAFTINPDLFYIHKKSYQREALFYINNHYEKGDAVYVYWNNLPGYKLYKEMYSFKFKAIEGHDFRNKSGDFDGYLENLKPDFEKFAANPRVWIVFNTHFLTDIGDKIDEPKWYYNRKDAAQTILLRRFSKNYFVIKKFSKKDLSIYLMIPKISVKSL
ncbi:hypothetical protein DHW03_05150 [Pedobacter yonginense]|uniref:Glycosyltransferase RgtA/B/C/D-like domain-containing protein n=1 Tax=Pedobacter yonginense TaxID=651869 RepID=A0A317EQQ0_9SPHI|nr:glycosyltransferase family 39 protein [Pedobacter yonginense]PWS29211.1 hypothetical protein DHW03_05150 [Pedobacter yonginense]